MLIACWIVAPGVRVAVWKNRFPEMFHEELFDARKMPFEAWLALK